MTAIALLWTKKDTKEKEKNQEKSSTATGGGIEEAKLERDNGTVMAQGLAISKAYL